MDKRKIITIVILLFAFTTLVHSSRVQFANYSRKVSKYISTTLTARTKLVTNYHKITEDFEELYRNNDLQKLRLDGRSVNDKFKKNIESIFEEKKNALTSIQRKASEAKQNHTKIVERFEYYNMRDIDNKDNVTLKIYPEFSTTVEVNMSHSFVQVPTNIYSYKQEVLNTVSWTKNLDETFKDNYLKSNGKLLYQYYGDESGLMRVYPGNKIERDPEKPDLFDCRRRVWYIQASASPKDVVIIIDLSGSMTGSKIGIARIAAASLIETLSEDDYFNVIIVNDAVNYIKPCAKHLIQATKLSKEEMIAGLQTIPPPIGIANADLAMEEAFKILNSEQRSALHNTTHNTRTTASCNKAIMFITDGIEGTYAAKPVFEKYNAEKQVRAFAFLIGRKKQQDVGRKSLLAMACDNRGHLYRIETVGNVWDKVLEYLQVMSRPMNSTKYNYSAIYTPMYLDGGGLGMIMSVSMGVFDKTGLIGVTGTDITLRSLWDKLPLSSFGPFSHIFVINNNGFVILHPKLKEQSGYLTAHRNVFLEDILHGADANQTLLLKAKMINQERNGTMSFPLYRLYDNNRKLGQIKSTVYYEPIDDTEFSAGVVLANDEIDYFEYSDKAYNNWYISGINALNAPIPPVNSTNYTYVEIAKWDYCLKPYDNMTPNSTKDYYTAVELYEELSHLAYDTIDDVDKSCNKSLIRRLLVTAGIVNKRLKETWTRDVINDDLYQGMFVATNGGYSKYVSMDKYAKPDYGDKNKPPFFDMAAANPKATISVSAPYVAPVSHDKNKDKNPDPDSLYFTVTAAVKVGKENVMTAVTGMKMRGNIFHQMLVNATEKEAPGDLCIKKATHLCMLLDRNGFIIASNQGKKYVGQYVGQISGILIQKLIEAGLFRKVVLNDTQAECAEEKKKPDTSASMRMLSPLKIISQGFAVLFQTLSWIAVEYSTFLVSTIDAKTNHRHHEKEIKKEMRNFSCVWRMPYVVFQEDQFKAAHHDEHKEANCDARCNMVYYLNIVENTNLLFLAAKTTKSCISTCTRQRSDVTRCRIIGTSVCKLDQRYRRKPAGCYNAKTKNEHLMCGSGVVIQPRIWILVSLFFIVSISSHM